MTIQEIKSQLSIATVLSYYDLQPNKNKMLSCPFHSDQKPSMKIYENTNTVYCFAGNCKIENLDVIDFIMKKENITKHEAIQKAKTLCNNNLNTNHKLEKMNPSKPDIELLTELFKYFEKGLKHSQTKLAKQYKENRGLNGKLEIGYNAGTFHQGKKEELLNRLQKSGLLKPSENGYQIWANKCLVWALKNKQDEIVSFYARSINSDGHFYLKNRKGLYPSFPGSKTKYLILTESVIDAASLLQLNLDLENYTVLALYGTNGLTTAHRQAILKCVHLQEIIFALDGDLAGEKATTKITKELSLLFPKLKYTTLNLPEGEDVNSLCVAHSDEESLFTHLLKNRKSVLSDPKKEDEKIEYAKVELTQNKLITNNKNLFLYHANQNLLIQILGGIKYEGLDRLRVTLKLKHLLESTEKSFRDNLDLYSAMQVEKFVKRASSRLEISSKFLEQSIDEMTEALEKHRLSKLESIKDEKVKSKVLTSSEIAIAKDYLLAKNLMEQTNIDIGKSGVVGEELNRLVLYIIYLSRKMSKPLHALIFGKSGSGKTHLQSGIAALVPEEDKLETTTLSDNAVYYFGENEISHFLILIEDMDGAEGVLLALRELQSKREVKKTVTIKDEKGKMKTITLIVKGPICLSGCTTKDRMYEDNANRSFLLYVDASQEQSERIMDLQRKESAGKINTKKQDQIREKFKNVQRLLKPIKVVNPFAEMIKIPKQVFKPRRTNAHVIHFIEAVTFYHQYQREVKLDPQTNERYIETTIEDIEWSFKLLAPLLLNKSDELSEACRSFFERLKLLLKEGKKTTFYQKEIRSTLRMNPSNIRYYLQELIRYDLVKKVGGSRYHGGVEYEVISMEDYTKLKQKITSYLQNILTKIRNSG